MILSLKVVGIDVDQKSENLAEDVPPKDSLRNEGQYCEHYFDRIFWSDISISDGSDYSNAVVHDVDIHLVPREKDHIIKGFTVGDPQDIWSVGSVVVPIIECQTDSIKEDSHEMGVEN